MGASRRRSPGHSVAAALVARPWLGAGVAAVLTLLALPQLAGLEVDNSLEVWLPAGGAERSRYEEFLAEFGSEEYVLVVYPLPSPLTDDFLERLVDLRFEIESLPGVSGVYDLSGIYSRFYALAGRARFAQDLSSPFYRHFLVSDDRQLAATWVLLDRSAAASRFAVVDGVRRAARQVGLETFWLAGSPVLNEALDEASTGAARRFFPLALVVSALLLVAVFKRLAGFLIPAISVGCGVIWAMAALVLGGGRLDMVTVALPPVLWVVGLATAIHLLSRSQTRLRRGEPPTEALRETLGELIRPCAMSALTTAVGFAALTVSAMRPVQIMGIYAAIGVFCCLAANLLLFPLLGRWWAAHRGRWSETSAVASRLRVLGERVVRRPRRILAVTVVLVLAASVGLTRLRAESNVLEFFSDDATIAETYERVLPALTGPYSLEVLLDPPAGVRDLATLERVDRLENRIQNEPGVARVLSVVDFVKKASMPIDDPAAPYALPTEASDLALAWERVDRSLANEVSPLISSSGALRLSVIARPMASGAHRRLVEALQRLLAAPELAAWKPRLTGVVTLLVELQEELLHSQIESFALAFLVIVPLIAGFFRSLSYAAASIPPNLVPILLTLGLMGFASVPLDPATVMIAAIAFGLSVDDSIHFLSHYRGSRRDGADAGRAAVETLTAVGRALWITSIVVAAGFGVLCFSSFRPLFYFGLLSAATALAALVGNLVLLPAIVVWLPSRLRP